MKGVQGEQRLSLRSNEMAMIYYANGATKEVQPANGVSFKLKEVQAIVDGLVEVVDLPNGKDRHSWVALTSLIGHLTLTNDLPLLFSAFHACLDDSQTALLRLNATDSSAVEVPHHVLCLFPALQCRVRVAIGPKDRLEGPCDDL